MIHLDDLMYDSDNAFVQGANRAVREELEEQKRMNIGGLGDLGSDDLGSFSIGSPVRIHHDDLMYPVIEENTTETPATTATTVSPLYAKSSTSGTGYDKLIRNLRKRESNNNYKAINPYGYIGAYQQGAAMLADLGIVKKGTSNKGLRDPKNWIKYNMNEYLNNKELQDELMRKELSLNKKYLKGKYKDEEDLYGMLAASHLLGAGGASKRNKSKHDANGTTFEEYYNLGIKSYR